MNEQLQAFARQTLKDGLAKLEERHREAFKLMYARNGGRRSVADALKMGISTVVDQVPAADLDWAMQQVQNSLILAGLA